VGSPLYEAPQILQCEPYGAKSDIWSIGIMFYEMLFATTPWPCKELNSYLKIVLQQQNNPVRFPYDKK